MPTDSTRQGDQYVRVIVRTPSKLTPEQQKLVEQLAETLPEIRTPGEAAKRDSEEKGFFERVRETVRETFKG